VELKEKLKLLLGAFWALGVFALLGVLSVPPANATAGINQELSFEGKVVNASGINIADATYNMEFKIYTGCTNNTGTGCSTVWTEDWLVGSSQGGIAFTSGTFQVNLGAATAFGSSVPWNTYPLYVSLEIGNTSSCTITTTFHTNCSGDGVMSPYILLTSTPYAMNSNQLGGLTASQYVQLGQNASPQGDASTNNSIYINKTAAGNIIDLQSSGTDAFIITNSGDETFGNNANHTISVTTAGSGVAGKQLTMTAGGAGSGASTLAGGNLVLQGGAGGGTNGAGGNVTIDAGVHNGSGADGTISIGTNNASAITLGNTTTNIVTTINGTVIVKPTTTHDTTTALQVQNAAGTTTVLDVDTTNQRIGINTTSPGARLHIVGDGTQDSLIFDQYNNGGGTVPDFIGRSANGTQALPTATASGDRLMTIGGRGYYTSGGTGFAGLSNATIQMYAAQNFTSANQGTYIDFETTPLNSTARVEVLRVDSSGNLQFNQASTIKPVSAATGNVMTVQGGAATSGTNVGGNLLLQGGAGASTGATGSVIVKANTNDSTTAFQVQNAAGTDILTVDSSNKKVYVRNANDLAVAGSEMFLAANSQTFATGVPNWTVTNNTFGQTVTAAHAPNVTNTLAASPNIAAVVGTTYQISYTVSGMTAGFVTAKFGGTLAGNSASANGTEVDIITATTTANFQFNPTTTFDGTITGVSIIPLTLQTATLAVNDSTGATAAELRVSTIANGNLGLGYQSLYGNQSGQFNVAVGESALSGVTTASSNTAVGYQALQYNSASNFNVAVGTKALQTNNGANNVAVGYQALQNAAAIANSVAIGSNALQAATTGNTNVAIGSSALKAITTGSGNIGIGLQSGNVSTTADFYTLATNTNATSIGFRSQADCNNCVILGGQGGDAPSGGVGIGTPTPTNFLSVEPVQLSTGTVSTHSTTTIDTLSTGSFTSAMVGSEIYVASNSATTAPYKGTITQVNSTTSITVTPAVGFTIAATHFYILYPGFQVTSTGTVYTQGASTSQFQVQNASATPLFNVDTTTTNLLSNPNFEISPGTTGWAATGTGATIAWQTANSALSYIGNDSLQVNLGSSGATGAQITGFTQSLATGTYTLSFYATGSTSLSGLAVSFGSGTCTLNQTTVTAGYFQRYWCTVTTTGTTSAITITSTTLSTAKLYLDGVDLVSGSTLSPYQTGNIQFQSIINNPATFQATSNSPTAFQILNNTSAPLFVVDSTTPNLIPNPGFETGTSSWALAGNATIAQNSTKANVYYGQASLAVTLGSTTPGATVTFGSTQATGNYNLSFYAMGNGAITLTNPTIGGTTCTLSSTAVTTTGFQRYSCSANAASTFTTITISSSTTSGILYIDSVQLTSGTTLQPYDIGAIQLRGIVNNPVAFQAVSNSTTALQVLNSSSSSILAVDTYNNRVTLGTGTGTNATLLTLGNKTDSGDPTCSSATAGAIYYNSSTTTAAYTGFRACRATFNDATSAASYSWFNLIAGVDVQTFTSNGTWTAPAGISTVMVVACGGGGSGGGGFTRALAAAAIGGGGGGGGARIESLMTATDAGASQAVTVGAQVSGGGAGSAGTAGNFSSFGSLVKAWGGGAGAAGATGSTLTSGGGGGGGGAAGTAGGTTASTGGDNPTAGIGGDGLAGGGTAAGGSGSGGENGGGSGAGTSTTTGIAGGASVYGGGGGGSGGSTTTGNADNVGGQGGNAGTWGAGGGSSGGTSGNVGTAGGVGSSVRCGGGGGGGGGKGSIAGNGGAGGAGGLPGGGGGGGGIGTSASTGGTGGIGAAGEVWVFSW
jgi:hypothetical protein